MIFIIIIVSTDGRALNQQVFSFTVVYDIVKEGILMFDNVEPVNFSMIKGFLH